MFVLLVQRILYLILMKIFIVSSHINNLISMKIILFLIVLNCLLILMIKIIFDTELERDKYADSLLNTIIQSINNKLFDTFNITNPSIIILISDTLLKVSLHIVYPDIINIYEMK